MSDSSVSDVPAPKRARADDPDADAQHEWHETAHMKKVSRLSDANFPHDPEGRVYHLAIKQGELANRVLSVGDPRRAELLAGLLDDPQTTFKVVSNRGFTVYTGTFAQVPVSIVATGMGVAMMDFVVRETRAVCSGRMAIIRLGTCGVLSREIGLGWAVVADASIGIQRNPDAFRPSPPGSDADAGRPYRFLRPAQPDAQLVDLLHTELSSGSGLKVARGVNGAADSFYSSQGRTSSMFDDRNEHLIEELDRAYPHIATLEMETFHLYDLAESSFGTISAAAAHVTLANRRTNEFANMSNLHDWESAAGRACLQALIKFKLDLPADSAQVPAAKP